MKLAITVAESRERQGVASGGITQLASPEAAPLGIPPGPVETTNVIPLRPDRITTTAPALDAPAMGAGAAARVHYRGTP
jgi:hypothetical protein